MDGKEGRGDQFSNRVVCKGTQLNAPSECASLVYLYRITRCKSIYYNNTFLLFNQSFNALPAEIQMCTSMGTAPINNDNIYKVGTFITAKEFPARKLHITAYMQRIYYCATVDQPEAKQLVYFERELIQLV
jgi:hypothetical protein